MRKQGHSSRARPALVASLIWGLSISTIPGRTSAEDLLGADFESFTGIPAEAVQAIPDAELDQLRGTYLGFYFSVTLSGMVEMGGAVDASLSVTAGLGDQTGGLAFHTDSPTGGAGGGPASGGPSVTVTNGATGEAFRIQAGIGNGAFGGAQGVFQISQVPGDNNAVAQRMIINLAIIQTPDSGVAAVRDALRPLFGF